MSDDLVKRLRSKTPNMTLGHNTMEEAADRIEELEAKLAKALEALETIAFECAGDEAAYTARTEDEVWNEAIEAAASTVAPPVTEQDSDRPEFFDAMDEVLDTRWHRIRALARPTKGETK